MPAHTGDNSDPSEWENPPVPSEWWEIIKEETPAFEASISPTFYMGAIPECFRCYPNVVRSNHPTVSFAAWGKNKQLITDKHSLDHGLSDSSPLGRIYELDGDVLLLGVEYENNTSMHLAEHRLPNQTPKKEESALLQDGYRVWKAYQTISYQDDKFNEIGQGFEEEFHVQKGLVGKALSTLLKQREIVDYTYEWLLRLED
jgi:aminoglycoside 3-N-acetyltransferase